MYTVDPTESLRLYGWENTGIQGVSKVCRSFYKHGSCNLAVTVSKKTVDKVLVVAQNTF